MVKSIKSVLPEQPQANGEHQSVEELKSTIALLTATLESTTDGILVVSKTKKFARYNQRFIDMWHIPEEVIKADKDDLALEYVLDQLKEPEAFRAKVKKLYADLEVESYDLLEFKDGRIFERYSRPQLVDGEAIGRVWSFRDVTERERADKLIEHSEQRFRFLNLLGEATNALTQPKEIMTAVAWLLGEHLNASRCAYAEVAADGDHFTIMDDYTDGCASTVGEYQLSQFGPAAFSELQGGHTYVVNDVDTELSDAEGIATFNAIEIKAVICGGLIRQGKLRALMAVHQTTPRVWQAHEVALVEEVMARSWAIIDRARAEDALRKSEQQNRAIFEQAAVGVGVIDIGSGRFISVNQRFCEITGYSHDQMVATTFVAITHPDDIPTDLENTQKLREGLIRNLTREKRYIRQNGTPVWVNLTLSAMWEPGEPPTNLIAVVQDITKRKQAEESMQLASLVYKNSSEAMMVTDSDNRILSINPAFTNVTGYTLDDVIGQNPSMLSSGRQDEAFYEAMWEQINTTGEWQGEIWDMRKNGETYAKWLTISTIYNTDMKVHRRVALFTDISKLKASEELIWQQANFDTLTGLPNRRMFHDRLAQELKKAQRANQRLAVLFLDLDHFKEVNDSLGHDMGDVLLKEAALRLGSCVRDTDTVARLGGDEFTIILGELNDLNSIERVCQKILKKMALPYRLNEDIVYLTVSIGITLYPEDASKIDVLLKNADQAMYAAKAQGRNRYHYFTTTMQEAALIKMRTTSDLRSALASNQLCLHYQPIVDLKTGKVCKAEALIRWQHPTQGLIGPIEFISIAEDTGMIIDIGNWVFFEAAKQVKEWRQTHDPDFQISINKSPVQFHSSNSVDKTWIEHLHQLGLPGQSIAIEITEGLLLDAGADVSSKLLAFRDAGIQVAIDDFGTGYSSLAYLKKFDIDYVKIDKSFVQNLQPGSNDIPLCEAIIVMAHTLDLMVIAEGVETKEQRELLTAMGCDYAQGYLFAKAVPAQTFSVDFLK